MLLGTTFVIRIPIYKYLLKTPEYYIFALLLNSITNFVGEPMNIAFVTHALIFVLWISMEMFALIDDVVKNFL